MELAVFIAALLELADVLGVVGGTRGCCGWWRGVRARTEGGGEDRVGIEGGWDEGE